LKQKPKKKVRHQHLEVLSGEGRRFSFSRIRQAFIFYLLLLIALVVIIHLGYHWLGGQFLAWRLQVVAAEPGVIEQEARANGIVTRKEEVVRAPADGLILQLANAGERVAAGTELIKIGVVSETDWQLLRGYDGHEPDEDLWRKLLNYWQHFFNQDSEDESEDDSEDDEERNEISEPVEHDQAGDYIDGVAFKDIIIIYNENPGHLSYYIDGWEEYNGPYYGPYEEGKNDREGSPVVEGDLVEKGQPILKIVDNWHWFYSVVLPLHPGKIIAGFPSVEIVFDFAPNEPVQAKLYHFEIVELTKEVQLTFIVEKQLTGFDQARWTEASLLFRRQQGIIVPAAALFEKERRTGVFLNQGGRVVFHPVTVIERQEDKVMVEGLTPYSLVISRPELVEEGQRLN